MSSLPLRQCPRSAEAVAAESSADRLGRGLESADAERDDSGDPAGVEDAIGDDFGTPDIDDASWAAAGEHGTPDDGTG